MLVEERLIQYVAQKLPCLPTTAGEETPHGDSSLPLREVRLEGLGTMIQYF
jgi:hypothetical protein